MSRREAASVLMCPPDFVDAHNDRITYHRGSGILAPAEVSEIHTTLAELLRATRVARGLSQTHLAQRWGFSVSVLSRLESGDRAIRLRPLIELSSLLLIRPSRLLYFARHRVALSRSTTRPLPWHSLDPRTLDPKASVVLRHVGNAEPLTMDQVSTILATTSEVLRIERERRMTIREMTARWNRKRTTVERTERADREINVRDLTEWGGLLCLPPDHILQAAENTALPEIPPWWRTDTIHYR